ncbi:MAG: hypothetical protein A3F11_10940 [Gammaproteobacteria bacterium RIFCSPHIGHO2_12_FULL_37_14]|nr:MAG: hypothetical protein A3F11_10940 [Gammaproteobacteria bacterium RIFCSPHIGHO2_12_FULL_37_14]
MRKTNRHPTDTTDYIQKTKKPPAFYAHYHTLHALAKLFGIKEQEKTVAFKSEIVSEGQGRLKLESLLNDDEYCFEHLSSVPPSSSKQKIILYTPFFKENITFTDCRYLQTLLDNYEIYILDEQKTPQLVKDLTDFIAQVKNIPRKITQEEAQRELALQGLAAQDYCPIDSERLIRGYWIFLKDEASALSNEATSLIWTDNKAIPTQTYPHIKHLVLKASISFISGDYFSHFPNLETIEIEEEPTLQGSNKPQVDFRVCKNLKSLIIKSTLISNCVFDITGLTQLEELKIENKKIGTELGLALLGLETCQNLKTLELWFHKVGVEDKNIEASVFNFPLLEALKKLTCLKTLVLAFSQDIHQFTSNHKFAQLTHLQLIREANGKSRPMYNAISNTTTFPGMDSSLDCDKKRNVINQAIYFLLGPQDEPEFLIQESLYIDAQNTSYVEVEPTNSILLLLNPHHYHFLPVDDSSDYVFDANTDRENPILRGRYSVMLGLKQQGHALDLRELRQTVYNAIEIYRIPYPFPYLWFPHFRTITFSQKKQEKIQYQALSLPIEEHSAPAPIIEETSQEHAETENQNSPTKENYTAWLSGHFEKDHYYVIPGKELAEKEDLLTIMIEPDKRINAEKTETAEIELFYNEEHQQFAIKLKKTFAGRISFTLKHNPSYSSQEFSENTRFASNTQALPLVLKENLKKCIDEIEELKFLKEPTLSPHEKLKQLIAYCKQFKMGKLNEVFLFDELATLIKIIKDQKGACGTRSQIFMLLAKYIGIPVRLVGNKIHAFCEIAILDEQQKITWRSIDLGGAGFIENQLEEPPAPKQDERPKTNKSPVSSLLEKPRLIMGFDTILLWLNEKHPGWKILISFFINLRNFFGGKNYNEMSKNLDSYQSLFQNLIRPKKFTSWETFLKETSSFVPLISLSQITPLMLNAKLMEGKALASAVDNPLTDCFYIDSPQDFLRLFKTFCINEQGKREIIDGPLKTLFSSNKKGLIIVNWTNFNETELASYKSILDPQATLLGMRIPPNIRIVGLIQEGHEGCPAFESRCERYPVENEDSFKTTPPQATSSKTSSSVQHTYEIDLEGRRDWEALLLGHYGLNNDKIEKQEGLLLKANKENNPLTILNPPDLRLDPAFHRFLYGLQVERKWVYEGILIALNPRCQIVVNSTQAQYETNTQVTCLSEKETQGRRRIYLNLNNLHQCYEQLEIFNETRKAKLTKGYLENYNSDTDVFWITGTLPFEFYQGLINEIRLRFPNKAFQFALAPGACITGYKQGPTPLIQTTTVDEITDQKTQVVFVSDDPDALVETLQKQLSSPLIIELTPQTNLSDLISRVKLSVNQEGVVQAECQESALLAALKTGVTVILKSAIAPDLYTALLPVLETDVLQKEITDNGNHHRIEGRLILVLPKSSQKTLPLSTVVEKTYSLDEYRRILSVSENDLDFKNFKSFYELACQMPHPENHAPDLKISLQRLRHSLALLKNRQKRHLHNPIKGLFHYDYSTHSQEFAYLNVLAKYYFDSSTSPQGHIEKLNTLSQKKETDASLWHYLNCCNGPKLRELLPELKIQTGGFPSLENPKTLIKKIKQLKNQKSSKQHNHIEKQKGYLTETLLSSDYPFVFLKGGPGTGKTHTVRHLLNKTQFEIYDGVTQIELWLTHKGNKQAILILDEANMAVPGTWDFLKGLANNTQGAASSSAETSMPHQIVYHGKIYNISSHHKVIFTGNPETYQQRYYHTLLQNYAETIYFKKPSRHELDLLLQSLFISLPLLNTKYYRSLIRDVYKKLDKQALENQRPSLRHLENFALRLEALFNKKLPDSLEDRLYQACISEFVLSFPKQEEQEKFKKELDSLFKKSNFTESTTPICIPNPLFKRGFFLPHTRASLLKALREDFQIRNLAIEKQKEREKTQSENCPPVFFKSVVLEGDSGLGKSTLFKVLLQEQGFLPAGDQLSQEGKRYYEISAGSSEIYDVLKKAHKEGAVVILDELNLDEKLEYVLNQYLCQPHPGKPGFMILASQNGSHFTGRRALSSALRDRLHVLHIADYNELELLELANAYLIPKPEAFVQARLGNARIFFTAINKALEQPQQTILGRQDPQ